MAETISRSHFWWGQVATIAAVFVAGGFEICKTTEELRATREESRRNHASALLREVADSVAKVSDQLRSHSDMYYLVANCLERPKPVAADCWHQEFSFDPDGSTQAWDQLNASVSGASPYLDNHQRSVAQQMLDVRKSYVASIRAHLSPQSPKDAEEIQFEIAGARVQLLTAQVNFRASVLQTLGVPEGVHSSNER